MAARGSTVMQFVPSEVYQSATPPESPAVGQLWRNSEVTPNELLAWNGKGASNARSYAGSKSGPTIRIEDLSDNRAISVATGAASTVKRTGKNLLPKGATVTASDVTMTVEADGTVTLNGTCTAAAGSPVIFQVQMGFYLNGQHTLSMNNAVAYGSDLQIRLMQSSGAQVSSPNTNFSASAANSKLTFTLSNQLVWGYAIRVGGGVTYNNVVIIPQLETGANATEYEVPDHVSYSADASGNADVIGRDGVTCIVSSALTTVATYTGSGWESLGAVQRIAVESVKISPEDGLRVDTILSSADGTHQVPTFFNARGSRYGLFRTSDGMLILGGMVLPNGQPAGVAEALVSPGESGDTRIGVETSAEGTGSARVDTAAIRLVQPSFTGATDPNVPTGEKVPVKIESVRSTLLNGQGQYVDNYSASIKALNALRLVAMGEGGSELAWLLVQRASEGSTIYTDGAYSASDSARTLSNFAPMIQMSMPTGESIVYNATARRYMLDWKTIGDDYGRYGMFKGGNQSLRDVGIVIQESGYYRFVFHADLEQASSSSGAVLYINRMPAEWTPPTSRDYATDVDLTPTRIAYRRAASAPLSASVTTCGLVADLWCFSGEKILPVVSTAAASKALVPAGTFFTAQKIG